MKTNSTTTKPSSGSDINLATPFLTALAPVLWGSTYIVTTQWLPPERPLTAAAIRALPAGIILVIMGRHLVPTKQILPMVVLSILNIALFQGLLFTSAYLLPGGLAAIVGALQPLLVMMLVWVFDHKAPNQIKIIAAGVAIAGMSILFTGPETQWNLLGVLAALVGTSSMAVGLFLSSKWNNKLPTLAFTGWQLLIGGLLLTPIAMVVEEPIHSFTLSHLLGYTYLSLFGALIGYFLWFRGLQKLPSTAVASLGLLSPVTATLLGWIFLDEQLGIQGSIGIAMVLLSVFVIQAHIPIKRKTFQPLQSPTLRKSA